MITSLFPNDVVLFFFLSCKYLVLLSAWMSWKSKERGLWRKPPNFFLKCAAVLRRHLCSLLIVQLSVYVPAWFVCQVPLTVGKGLLTFFLSLLFFLLLFFNVGESDQSFEHKPKTDKTFRLGKQVDIVCLICSHHTTDYTGLGKKLIKYFYAYPSPWIEFITWHRLFPV